MNSLRLIELFLKLASIDGVSGNEKAVAEYIKSFLVNLNFSVEEDTASEFTKSNTNNIICKIGSGGNFVMLSHMDTARPTEKLKPQILEDRIISSGDTVLGVDNRAGIAVLLYTLEKISQEKISVKDFTVAFTTCEETTLFGSKYLGINGNINHAFIFDSGYRPGNFIYASCGDLGFKIKIFGKASHSGIAPEKGINAMAVAANAISRLPLGRIDDDSTMNIGLFKSGSAVNVIPEYAELEGEIRSFDVNKVKLQFDETIKIFEEESAKLNAKIEFEYFWDFKPFTISEKSHVFQETKNAIEKVKLTPTPKISLGGSDANSLNERGIEAINLGIGAQNPHSNDEFIYIEDLIKSAEIALEIIKK
ncbi:MAG: M20/M25/M40 family metallo-hydrolase [Ignavibacteriales bacterium]|nr:M20/M25/M40 family metallo-hydrolase [Ignavibacteriales bacterium]